MSRKYPCSHYFIKPSGQTHINCGGEMATCKECGSYICIKCDRNKEVKEK